MSSVKSLIHAVQKQMLLDFVEKSKQVPHALGRGLAREDVVRDFLNQYLPERFAAEDGFVIDAAGRVSKQIDAVVYDRLSAPVFRVTKSQRLLPAEAVAGVVSIKSYLDERNLRHVVDNLSTVTALDRFASGRPNFVYGGVPVGLDLDEPGALSGEPIFAAAFAFDSPSLDTVARTLDKINEDLDPRKRVQLIVVLNRGVITYLLDGIVQPSYDPQAQVAYISDEDVPSLPVFYSFLTNSLMRKMPLYISLRAYLDLAEIPVTVIEKNH